MPIKFSYEIESYSKENKKTVECTLNEHSTITEVVEVFQSFLLAIGFTPENVKEFFED